MPNPGSEESRIRTKMMPGLAVQNNMGEPVTKEDIAKEVGAQRPFYLMRKDIKKAAEVIGYTPGCKGCKAVRLDYRSRPMHTDECRTRMEAEVRKTARGAERMTEFERKLADDVEARVARGEACGSTVHIGSSVDVDASSSSAEKRQQISTSTDMPLQPPPNATS